MSATHCRSGGPAATATAWSRRSTDDRRPRVPHATRVTILAAAAVGLGFAIAALLIVPAARRTGLGIWHPAIAWLGLEAVFFGVGAAILVTQGRDGPACY